MMKITYNFPFPIPEKERERVNPKTFAVYSPVSTKTFYHKIRSYIHQNYKHYMENQIDFPCNVSLVIGIIESHDKSDLDNRIKMLDSLNKEDPKLPKKYKVGFIGIWTDDRLIKSIQAKIVYVDSIEDEFTTLEITKYNPKGGE